jgi:AcrR family transcriptional regulator
MSTYEAVVLFSASWTRRTHSGLFILYKPNISHMKNKENTKRKLLNAVGNIIRNEGFAKLGVNKIARYAGVSKILIYRYFGGYRELIRAYIAEKDFWKNYLSDSQTSESMNMTVRERVFKVLKEQSNHFFNHCEMEALLVTESSHYNSIVKCIGREEMENKGETYRTVVSTLLLAGTDHLILAGELQDKAHRPEIFTVRKNNLMQSIGQLVEWTLG